MKITSGMNSTAWLKIVPTVETVVPRDYCALMPTAAAVSNNALVIQSADVTL